MTTPWQSTILTLFPAMFPGPLGVSLAGRALEKNIWSLETINIRDFAFDKHRSVDDTPAGGGPGMVMRADVVGAAIDHAMLSAAPDASLIYLSPRGKPFTQKRAHELAKGAGVILLCGRFEGLDERVIEARLMEEISIGDYVLSGGEIPAMVMLDAIIRLLPGVVGSRRSLESESFEDGLLEYPQYTKPNEWEGRKIPPVLTSGNHGQVDSWRQRKSMELTKSRRPDLIGDKRGGNK